VTPQPKLFQLFHPSGGVTAGLPGAASATGCGGATENSVSAAAAAASRWVSRLRNGVNMVVLPS
jgi:hypothetical protein